MVRLVLLAALLASVSGCQPFLARLLQPPGPIQQQRYQATLHDPYPTPHGIPGSEGSRPPGYFNPLPQAVQDRYLQDIFWYGRGRPSEVPGDSEAVESGLLDPVSN
jgi:hypothetical protein